MNTDRAPGTAATCAGELWRASNLVHLIYLVFPFFQPFFDPHAAVADWVLAAGVVLAFLPLYVLLILRPDRFRLWCACATLLGAGAVPFNSGTSVVFVYAGAFAALYESRPNTWRWLGGLTVLSGLLFAVSTVPMAGRLPGSIPSVVFLWVIGLIQIDNGAKEREATALRVDKARSEHLATLAERERIARDLHDLIGHSLTAVIVRAQLVGQLAAADPERASGEAAEIERTAREALSEVRSTVSGWRSVSIEDEIESARAALGSVGVELTVRKEPGLTLVSGTEHALALALREAVTNVARHAGARTCHVSIGRQDGEVRLVVADDGVGGRVREGNGLGGMRERIAAIGGRVQLRGSAGTTVTVGVPTEVAT
ncbi:sensor histidine kinase [Amycolatopsis cihanbeyliensis]|uniref:Two-component system sensor histidine kinase DesK n=1 Tax=Amycolatopsis cihanbeyliensis TaxID=1128664 RepID=A0A542DK86_AMYCI|nr:sensor histidine kinase [Amycolatopsis cihanbeyliensis]TQJ03497.1 two-component system sensor histidine kinase DesK [Amycolatopsis cihanbeyliensis]